MAIKTKIDGNSRISLSDDQLFDQSTANTSGGIDSTSANTFIGYLAGQNVDAGSVQNTFIGHGVGDASLNDSVGNTGIGANVLSSLTTGDYNTIIGRGAGESMTSGAQNTVIGNSAFSSANSDNVLSKAPLPAIIVFSFNNEILEKFLLNFITAPSNTSSLNKIFEPAPIINNFSSVLHCFKNSIRS